MNNFKRFYGTHEIDLLTQPELDKTLVLIGGDNGRGKTSIHEAINYVFYEDGDLPGIQTRPNYLRAVSDRLNRRALDEGKIDYSVAVELIVSGGDADRRLYIQRSWEVDIRQRQAITPVLSIQENGRPIDWIEDNPAAYQDFLRHVLPPRISPFFFFDGERIQNFAEEESHDRQMVEAIEDILHITVYKTLREDLRKHVIEYIEKREVKAVETGDFFKLQEDAETIESELDRKRNKLIDVEREIEEDIKEKRRIEDELIRIASPHASKREELILDKQRLEGELEVTKADIQNGFESLPILLVGKLRDSLQDTLQEEQRTITNPEQIANLRKQIDTIEKRVFISPQPEPPPDVSLHPKQTTFYRDLFRSVSMEVLGLRQSDQRRPLHDLSDGERQDIIGRLTEAAQKASILREAVNARERINNELRDVEAKLLSTSDDPHVMELIQQNGATSEQIGKLQEESDNLKGEIQRREADLKIRIRQIEERQEQRKATTEAMRVIKLARKAQGVLDDFIHKLAPEKLNILKNHFEEMYNRLRKPEDPFRTVKIDSNTWQVILQDEHGRRLERRVFSAGMREMYALALLWALARASGRELPIVIDTPVARLDTTNRRVLFEKYLPYAGHQVIVLSTDTEVDVKWAERLSPFVSKQYRLDYDRDTDSNVVRVGYFF
jgi:DNA sulfur modification protein DndD